MSKIGKRLVAVALVGGLAAAIAYVVMAPQGSDHQGGRRAFKGALRGPVPVIATPAKQGDVPIYLEGLGTVRALNTVTVQPLVDGRLISVQFVEGQNVRKGDVLARIDPSIYEAELAQANAKKAQDEAQLADARNELERVSNVGRIATLQKSIDTARAQDAQYSALVKADQAAIDLAATQLGYTEIKAPIDGRTGIRMVDEGNVVRASANSAIVVITQVQPISVLFSLPQQELGRINAAVAKSQLSVDVLGPDGKTVLDSGKLQVVDNQVDQTTGTVKLKAEFKNADLQLWPGQFVNVRLLINTLKQVVIVPTAAIQQGPDGTFVFAVADGDKVTIRPVKVGQRDDRETVVAAGLSVGERVVTTGFSRLREGTPVAVSGPEVSAASKGKGKNAAHSGNGKGKGKGRRRSREASGAEASIQAQGGHGGSEAGWRARPRPSGDSTAP